MNLEKAVKQIRIFFQQSKRLPSYKEMADLLGYSSKNASFYLVGKLIKKGILEKDNSGRLIPKNLFPPLPILGVIKAGQPDHSEQQLLDTLAVNQYLAPHPENSYLLKVTGDSMIDAGIFPNDLVVIEKDQNPKIGSIVVAFIDGEFTLKYLNKQRQKICLMAANKKYPTFYPKENLEIFGRVISVIRKYR